VVWRLKSLSGNGLGFDALLAIFGGNGAKSNGVKKKDLVRIHYFEKYFDDTFKYRHVVLPPEVVGNEVEASPGKTSQTSLSVVLNAWFLAGFYTYTLVVFTERRQRSLIRWVLKRKTKASDPDAPDFDGDGIVV
ncbi:two-pore potassium channel 1-like protein, partial [Tanacetum coccineum]